MQLNLPFLTLCLLGTVFLCVEQGQSTTANIPTTADQTTPAASNPTTAADTGPTKPDPTKSNPTKPEPTKPEPTKPEPTKKPDGTTEAEPTTDPSTGTTEDLGKGPEPLSDGAVAGIAIGSIAGVAAVGGGIFGALKYMKKI